MSSNVRREGLPVPVNRGLLLASAKKRRDLIRSERQRLSRSIKNDVIATTHSSVSISVADRARVLQDIDRIGWAQQPSV